MKAELESVLASELAARKFAYARSDGSPWTLALKDVLDRAANIEMAYNLNDCMELRWGAPDKSTKASNLPAARAVDAARENDRLSELVPRAAPPAARLTRVQQARSAPPPPNSGLPEFGTLSRPKSDKSDFGWERMG